MLYYILNCDKSSQGCYIWLFLEILYFRFQIHVSYAKGVFMNIRKESRIVYHNSEKIKNKVVLVSTYLIKIF